MLFTAERWQAGFGNDRSDSQSENVTYPGDNSDKSSRGFALSSSLLDLRLAVDTVQRDPSTVRGGHRTRDELFLYCYVDSNRFFGSNTTIELCDNQLASAHRLFTSSLVQDKHELVDFLKTVHREHYRNCHLRSMFVTMTVNRCQ